MRVKRTENEKTASVAAIHIQSGGGDNRATQHEQSNERKLKKKNCGNNNNIEAAEKREI